MCIRDRSADHAGWIGSSLAPSASRWTFRSRASASCCSYVPVRRWLTEGKVEPPKISQGDSRAPARSPFHRTSTGCVMGGKRAGVVTLSAGAVLPVCGCSLSLEWRRVAEALIWLVQMTRGSPFARCWSTAPEVASYRRVGGRCLAAAGGTVRVSWVLSIRVCSGLGRLRVDRELDAQDVFAERP